MTARPKYFTFTPSDEDTDGLANDLTGAGPWSSGNFVTTTIPDGLAHQLSLTSAANLSAINITLTGTDADGKVISETIAGPNANTVETTKFFKTLTAVSASATLGANVLDVGWVDEFSSPTIPLERYLSSPCLAQVTLTGTANFDIEDTMSELYPNPNSPSTQDSYTWLNDANFTNKSASLSAALAVICNACRLVVNSYSSGAVLKLAVLVPT